MQFRDPDSLSNPLVLLLQAETSQPQEVQPGCPPPEDRSHFKDIVTGGNGQGHNFVNETHYHQDFSGQAHMAGKSEKSLPRRNRGPVEALSGGPDGPHKWPVSCPQPVSSPSVRSCPQGRVKRGETVVTGG